jgi:hypothetical protein
VGAVGNLAALSVIASQRVRLRRPNDRLREAIQTHVIASASEAIQSPSKTLDCFVAFAPRNDGGETGLASAVIPAERSESRDPIFAK